MSKEQTTNREAAREPVRAAVKPVKLQPGEHFGRNGEVLRRSKSYSFNQYDVPESMLEEGWSYQWNTVSVYGQPAYSEINRMMDNGWRYVSPDNPRFAAFKSDAKGRDNGYIELDGLALMERPSSMTEEARAEEQRLAESKVLQQIERADTDMDLPKGFKAEKAAIKKGKLERVPASFYPERTRAVAGDDD